MRTPKRGLIGLAILGATVAGLAACNPGEAKAPTVESTPPGASPLGEQTVIKAVPAGSADAGTTTLKVTISNHSTSLLDVNPFNFHVFEADGTDHPAYVTGNDSELDAVTLKPEQQATGKLTFRGVFTPKTITFEEDGFNESARSAVK